MGVYENDNGNLKLISGATLYADAPIGAISAFGGATAPQGWLLCHGQAISRTDYAELFAVIGTAYGSGDGSTTFNVPDIRDKFVEGASSNNPLGNTKSAGLPNIEGSYYSFGGSNNDSDRRAASSGAFYEGNIGADGKAGGLQGSTSSPMMFDASRANNIYGNSETVQPPAVCANWIIKAQQVALPMDIENQVETVAGNSAEAYIEQKLKGVLEYTLTVGGQWENYTTNHMVARFVDESSGVDYRIQFADIVQGNAQNYNTIGKTSEGRNINIFRGAIGSNIVYVSIEGTSTDHIKCYGCDF